MRDNVLRLYIKMQSLRNALLESQSGQDLIEYALVVALISLAATAGMSSVATKISAAFTAIGTKFTSYTS
jgi:pilus assembly protein Flp/PilA